MTTSDTFEIEIPHVSSCSERGNRVYRATTTCKNELNFNMECIISLWWKKKTVCAHFPLVVILHIHSTLVFCVQLRIEPLSLCLCPPVCRPFLPVHWLLFSPFLIIPQRTRGIDWTELGCLSVTDGLSAAVSLYANLSTFAAVCLSVCLPLPVLPCPALPSPPSPPSLYDCQTVCRPTSDCCSLASLFCPGNAPAPKRPFVRVSTLFFPLTARQSLFCHL